MRIAAKSVTFGCIVCHPLNIKIETTRFDKFVMSENAKQLAITLLKNEILLKPRSRHPTTSSDVIMPS